MFQTIPKASSILVNQTQGPTRHLVGRLVNQSVLRSFALMRRESPSTAAAALGQQRTVVNKAAALQLQKLPTAMALQSGLRSPSRAAIDMAALQNRVLSETGSSGSPPTAYSALQNPTAHDVERLIDTHGPAVRLTLYGLRDGEDATAVPSPHTVLVSGTLRGEDGTCYAVVVDGDTLAKNPVRSLAEDYARNRGKSLHDLDQQDFGQLDAQLSQLPDQPTFGQVPYRLVNLDRAIENHHAIVDKRKNYVDRMAIDLSKEGLTYPVEDANMCQAHAIYDPGAMAKGNMPAEVKQALLAQISTDPSTVEPFAGVKGPSAPSDVFVHTPGLEDVFNAPSAAGPWKPPTSVDELSNVLSQESSFEEALATPGGRQWVQDLFDAISAKEMPRGDRGIELIARFKMTYGTIAHTSLASLWRDQEGKLQMGLVHQESIPINKNDWEGRVYTGYDTARDYPTGHAPVVESINLVGLPDVKVLTTKYPDKIKAIGEKLSGADNAYPYGATESWNGSHGRFSADKPFYTCFNVTKDVHRMMLGEYPTYAPLYPDIKRELGTVLWNTDYRSIESIKVGDGHYAMDTIMQQPFPIAAAMFNSAGSWWGNDGAWDVKSPRGFKGGKVTLAAGERKALPQGDFPMGYEGAIFINPKGMQLADATPVKRSVHYTPEQISGMTYQTDKPGKLIFYAGVERSHEQTAAELQKKKLSETFWLSQPSLPALIEQVRMLAKMPDAQVPSLTNARHAQVSDAYESIFANLSGIDLAPLGLSSTERYLLSETYDRLFGGRSPILSVMAPSLMQAAGRFDPGLAKRRLEQAEAYVHALKTSGLESVDPKQLDAAGREALVRGMVDSAREIFGFSSVVNVSVKPNAHVEAPGTMAMVRRKGDAFELDLYPEAFQGDRLTMLGIVVQECVHVAQLELVDTARANEVMRESREQGGQDPVHGPLLPREQAAEGHLLRLGISRSGSSASLDYPMRMQHERDGWMTEIAAKVFAAHTQEFGTVSAHASIYADITLDELHDNGAEGLLAAYAKRKFGVDMAQLAALCGVRDAAVEDQASATDALSTLIGLKGFLHQKLSADLGPDATKLLSEFRADLLGEIVDVLYAAERQDHPCRRDAQLLISMVYETVGLSSPLSLFKAAGDVDSLVAQCATEAGKVRTPLGAMLLYRHALSRCRELDVDVTPTLAGRLKVAANATDL